MFYNEMEFNLNSLLFLLHLLTNKIIFKYYTVLMPLGWMAILLKMAVVNRNKTNDSNLKLKALTRKYRKKREKRRKESGTNWTESKTDKEMRIS